MQRWSKWTICAVTYRRETRRRGNLSWRSRKCYGKVKRRRHRWRKASETAADIAALWSSSPGTSGFTAKSAQLGQGFQFVFCFLISIYDYDERCENNLSLKLKRLILILVQLWTAQSDARHLGADVCCVVLSSVDIGYRNIKCDVNADVVHRCATLAFGTCSHSLSPFFFFTSIWLYLSQWEGQSREAGVRTAAGGGLPACRAGGAAGLLAGASENAGLPDATEGGSWDAADTPANRGPERVHTLVEEWPLRTSRPLWLSSSSVYLEFRLVTHVTVRITFKRKCKWFTLHYCTHALGSLSTPPPPSFALGFCLI